MSKGLGEDVLQVKKKREHNAKRYDEPSIHLEQSDNHFDILGTLMKDRIDMYRCLTITLKWDVGGLCSIEII